MHHVAVSNEEQSKNIGEIATAATALTDASGRITQLVRSFRLGGSVLSVDNSWVSVFLDRHLRIEEPDESNNRMNKKI